MAPGGLVEVGEDAPGLLVVGAPAAVEAHAPVAAFEQRNFKMLLQHADAVGNGGRGDLKLLGGAYEVLVPGGGGEEAQAIEGRQGLHGRWLGGLPIHILQNYFVIDKVFSFSSFRFGLLRMLRREKRVMGGASAGPVMTNTNYVYVLKNNNL